CLSAWRPVTWFAASLLKGRAQSTDQFARAEIPKNRGPHPGEGPDPSGNPLVCSQLGALDGLIFRDKRLAPQTVCRSSTLARRASERRHPGGALLPDPPDLLHW